MTAAIFQVSLSPPSERQADHQRVVVVVVGVDGVGGGVVVGGGVDAGLRGQTHAG